MIKKIFIIGDSQIAYISQGVIHSGPTKALEYGHYFRNKMGYELIFLWQHSRTAFKVDLEYLENLFKDYLNDLNEECIIVSEFGGMDAALGQYQKHNNMSEVITKYFFETVKFSKKYNTNLIFMAPWLQVDDDKFYKWWHDVTDLLKELSANNNLPEPIEIMYNETLNTATRGSRREFPSVAVIVASTSPNRITIYDGDDPDMPMWMVFTSNANQYGAIFDNRSVVSIVAMNGSVIWADSLDSVVDASFIRDNYISTAVSGSWNSSRNILDRNPTDTNNLWTRYNAGRSVIGHPLNDLAITVLPNAPIDPSTNLAIPTVAVATVAGVSIIKDDGSVENTDNANIVNIGFIKGDRLAYGHRGGYEYAGRAINVAPVRNSLSYGFFAQFTIPSFGISQDAAGRMRGVGDGYVYGYDYDGIRRIYEDETNKPNGMANYITTTYNTGWLHGDIKGAFLSDTSTTSVTGTELIINGTFDSNTDRWNAHPDYTNTTLSIDSNRLKVQGGGAQQAFSTTIGKRYIVTYTLTEFNSGGIYLGTGSAGTQSYNYFSTGAQSSGTYTYYFVATSTVAYITLFAWNIGTTYAFYDNVSVRLELELDRSVNNKGLAVYGTITKSAVATGANLVGYSGFSSLGLMSLILFLWMMRSDTYKPMHCVGLWIINPDSHNC